jgi:outer membrane protease
MNFKVKTNFAGEVDLELEEATIEKLLTALSQKVGYSIYSPNDRKLNGDFMVYLNGQEYENLPSGVDTQIGYGDRIEVNMVVLVGG